ncbi:hypothetical protein SMICM304S_07758 [Streptomyces microflavus]
MTSRRLRDHRTTVALRPYRVNVKELFAEPLSQRMAREQLLQLSLG